MDVIHSSTGVYSSAYLRVTLAYVDVTSNLQQNAEVY